MVDVVYQHIFKHFCPDRLRKDLLFCTKAQCLFPLGNSYLIGFLIQLQISLNVVSLFYTFQKTSEYDETEKYSLTIGEMSDKNSYKTLNDSN